MPENAMVFRKHLIRFLLAAFVWPVGAATADEAVSVADSVRKYRFLATDARKKKEYDAALGYYQAFFQYESDPKKKQKSYYFYGDILYRKKEYGAAKGAFLNSVAIDSLHRNSNLRLYALYKSEGKPDSAALALERVLLKKPADAKNRRDLADLYRRQGRVAEAVGHYETLVGNGEDAQNIELLQLLAVIHQDAGQAEAALQWKQRLAAVQGEDGRQETLESMVDLHEEKGDLEAAVAGLQELARLDGANRYAYFFRMVPLAEQLGDDALKIEAWEGMVDADPADLKTVAELADWYMGAGDVAKARAWVERGLAQEPAHGQLQLIKGDLLVEQGDEEGALAAFASAKADPGWERVAQQRIWQIRPPETEEEKLKRAFFGGSEADSTSN